MKILTILLSIGFVKKCSFYVVEEAEIKVKDHDRIPGKYRETVHQEYHLNLCLSRKIPVVFHKLQNYDSHLIFKEI